jgi:type I restriction-modification system DNA methylase subunit
MSQTGFLELVHEKLHWPSPDQILEPSGAGAKFYAELADKKIGQKLRRERPDASGVKVGILAANPQGTDTEAPIAIICEFPRPVSDETIQETYRLAWSFSRARSLITLEPNLLRVWSCCEHPKDSKASEPVITSDSSLSEQAAKALQWVELVSGQFFQNNNDRFKKSGSADQMLLSNLKEVRRQLHGAGLHDYTTIHDLLARIIFIQFLFQKRDSEGNPALNERILQNLYTENILSKVYQELPELLETFDDTYRFFRWLNSKFNGDLFPGKGESQEEQEIEWQAEIDKIRTEDNRYLNILSRFVRGDLEMRSGQLSLWKYYSFDVIPLDFISSIYEEFVSKNPDKGVHYTPEHIVDFVLDGVLPWDGEQWDLKILDPCCGSGIFLVKAFQRLIYRWEKAHIKRINAENLRYLLENNLFGIDVDEEAIRVASLSFYLTMLDSLDPLDYWENAQFPMLRNRRLITADFFEEDKEGFSTELDTETYDLVVGNAPWGKNTVTDFAKKWEYRQQGQWNTSYGNIAPLFLAKAAELTKICGRVSMMQPTIAILFYQDKAAVEFRKKLILEFKIEEITNLSALRFGLFKKAISPACIITFQKTQPNGEPIVYICPKSFCTNDDDYRLIIEPQDINNIYTKEAIEYPFIWAVLMWGSRRDFSFMKFLSQQQSISKLATQEIAVYTQGVIRGNRKDRHDILIGRKLFDGEELPINAFYLSTASLAINQDPYAERPRKRKKLAFDYPQLLIKQSWQVGQQRFQSALVNLDRETEQGIICSGSYVSVHMPEKYLSLLEGACLSYNSKLAAYYLLLSSGSFSSYIPKANVDDLMQIPIPENCSGILKNLKNKDNVDQIIQDVFSFKNSQWLLVEDLFKYTLPDFKGNNASLGRQRTQRLQNDSNMAELELSDYCDYFLRVIRSGFGQNKQAFATIFQESCNSPLPIRLVAIHLNYANHEEIKVENIDSSCLIERLAKLNELFITQENSQEGGIFYQRVARIYDSVLIDGVKVPTVYLIKPDRVRYWTRSMALRDADEVVADIMASSRTHT